MNYNNRTILAKIIKHFINSNAVVLQVINSKSQPIINKKMLLIGPKKLWINSDSKGLIYINNVLYGMYELRLYTNKNVYLSQNVYICKSGFYSVKITNSFYGELYGTIFDKNTKVPIYNAVVILFKYSKKNNTFIPIKSTLTDKNGNYCFCNIPYESYMIKSIK